MLPVCIVFGFLICYLFFKLRQVSRERTSKNVIKEAKLEAERILKGADIAAREDLYKRKERLEKETQETRQELRQLERRLSKREDNLERKIDILTKKEKYIESMASNLSNKERDLNNKNLRNIESNLEEKFDSLSTEATKIYPLDGGMTESMPADDLGCKDKIKIVNGLQNELKILSNFGTESQKFRFFDCRRS